MTADQLRKSILQQAIQGKLVPQDPNDEPASALLERIREEKARLVKEKKIKKEKNPSVIFRGEDNSHYEKFILTGEVKCIDDEIPFELPKGWEWCRIKDICTMQAGKNISASVISKEKSLLHQYKCIGGNGLRGYVKDYNTEGFYSIVGRQGALCGCLHIEKGKFYATEHAVIVDSWGIISPVFMYYILTALNLNQYSTATAQPGLSVAKIITTFFPLPPLAEQQRIVAKIEELMPLVEQYDKAQSELEVLNTNIREQLKKSILQYAIEGKLVPQCEEDGTAEDLLQEIQSEKQRLYAEGKLKKKDLTHSTIFRGEDNKYYEQIGKEIVDITEEIPYELPNGWSFCRLKDICSIFTGATFRKEEATSKISGVRILRGGNILPRKLLYKSDDIFLSKDKVPHNILLKKNDIVTPAVTSLENIGKMARVTSVTNYTAVGGFVFTLRLYKCIDVISIYLQSLLSSPLLIKHLKSISNKSGQAFYNIGKERLGMALLPIPTLGEQQRITQAIENLFELIEDE